jgi:putative transposase
MSKEEKLKVAYNVYKTSDDYEEACRLTGISIKTYYRWRRRFRSWGLRGSLKRIGKWSYGKKPVNKVPDRIRHTIEWLKRESPAYGYVKISKILERDHKYKVHPDTVRNILRERGLQGRTKKYPRRSKAKWDRVIPYYPGDVIQADPINYGELWVINFQDILIKWRAAVVVDELNVESVKKELKGIFESFPYEVKNLQWDNGSETEKDLAEYLETECGIVLRHTAPGSPWQNGTVERLNGIMREEEFGYKRYKKEEKEKVQRMLEEKVKKYNEYRPHWGIGLKTPLQMVEDCRSNEYLRSFVKFASG